MIYNRPEYWLKTKQVSNPYLTFSSPSSFTLKVNDTTKHLDGTLEYFASNKTWTVLDGITTLSSIDNNGEYVLYLRGTGNTVITENNYRYKWILTGSDIACIGNIENLLDYTTVVSGAHPTMANYCYRFMFEFTAITAIPRIMATTYTTDSCKGMFDDIKTLNVYSRSGLGHEYGWTAPASTYCSVMFGSDDGESEWAKLDGSNFPNSGTPTEETTYYFATSD